LIHHIGDGRPLAARMQHAEDVRRSSAGWNLCLCEFELIRRG